MARSPGILLLDDGELDDVQEILEGIGAPFGRVRGGAIAPNTPPPSRLLVSTPRRIGMVHDAVGGDPDGDGVVRIVVVEGDSPSLRAKLREIGFDYLVRRPVHPEALRLLLLHCLYTGEERRREPRVPVGFEVSFRTGLLPRRAAMVELSSGGCRLQSSYRLEPDATVRIQIPKAVGTSEVLSLPGRVLRVDFDEDLDESGLYCAAVVFEDVDPEVRHELEWILEERARGPATLATDAPEAGSEAAATAPQPEPASRAPAAGPGAGGGSAPAVEVDVRMEASPEPASASEEEEGDEGEAPGDSGSERRRSPRGAFERKVPAFGARALRVLLGRDLSARGMRIERFPELEIGDRLHLAVYGEAGDEPLLVWATVSRDDAENGMALVFDELHPLMAEQLEKLVAGLPAVESLRDDEGRAMGSVVSEILGS